MEYETGECKSCEKLAEKIAAIEWERDESRKWAAAQARFINKLEAENAGLQKAHDFWRDQCESFEAQLSGKIKDNALLRKRLEPIQELVTYINSCKYLSEHDWQERAYDAIKKCMELKEGR